MELGLISVKTVPLHCYDIRMAVLIVYVPTWSHWSQRIEVSIAAAMLYTRALPDATFTSSPCSSNPLPCDVYSLYTPSRPLYLRLFDTMDISPCLHYSYG